jgi:hypothetical protein
VQIERKVSVDSNFARFGDKSYAVSKINSVEVRRRHPYGRGLPFCLGLLTLICGLSALGGGGAASFVLALVFGGLTYLAWRRSETIEYQLFLMTSSSEAQALTSRDGPMIESLRDQIERAMVGQLACSPAQSALL